MSDHSGNQRVHVAQLTPDPTSTGSTFRTLLRTRPLTPDRAQLVDAGFGLVLAGLALRGLHETFTGAGYLVVGLLGCLLGLLMAHVAHALRLPIGVLAAGTVVVFFLLGSVLALRAAPLPSAFSDLVHQLVHGWKDLLTTLPPVDGDGPLLVIPYVLGLLSGALSQTLAVRSKRSWAPLVGVLALLAAVILLGVQRPASLLVQGGVIGVLGLCWMSLRGFRRLEPVRNGSASLVRLAMGAGIVAVALGSAVPLGDEVLASDADRVVLRDHVEPPFDIGRYPSPLASFRLYPPAISDAAKSSNLNTTPLFTVEGAPVGTPLRIATLDAYDGRTWGAANTGGSPGQVDDTYQRVSRTIANPLADGLDERSVRVTVNEGWSGVWMPTVGDLTGLRFTSGDADAHAEDWRYNLATGGAVLPSGLTNGDSYTMTTVLPDDVLDPDLGASGDVTVVGAEFLQSQASAWSADAGDNALDKVLAIAAHLKENGTYTDGKAPYQRYTGGHYQARLAMFVDGDQIAGNDEQYAATMALLSNLVGVPARVVLGALVPEGGIVTGDDVEAWVELRVSDGTWRRLPTEEFMGTELPDPRPPQTETTYTTAVVPPPAPIPPPSTVGDPADSELQTKVDRNRSDEESDGFRLPGWLVGLLTWVGVPLGLLLLLAGVVVALKARRRRRRRHAPDLARRFSGGWAEVVDRARDLGISLPGHGSTRTEQALTLTAPSAYPVARATDDHVFAAAPPTEADATAYWQSVEGLCRELRSARPFGRRLVAAVSPVTLVQRGR